MILVAIGLEISGPYPNEMPKSLGPLKLLVGTGVIWPIVAGRDYKPPHTADYAAFLPPFR